MRQLSMIEIQSLLLHSIMEHYTVQRLLHELYEIIHLPMICFDPSFSLIAYAFQRPCPFFHWEWIVQHGAASEETIAEYNYFTYQEQMIMRGEAAVFSEGTCYGFPQACGAIMNGDQLMAYCGIMIEDVIPEQVIEAANLLIKAICVLMRREEQKDGLDFALIQDHSLSVQQADYLRNRYRDEYVFFVLTCSAPQRSVLQYVKSYMQWRGRDLISCLGGEDMLFLLLCSQNPTEKYTQEISDLYALTHKYHLYVGQSDRFSDPEHIPVHREQALLALSYQIGRKRQSGICSFVDEYVSFLCQAVIERYGKEACLLPEIRWLEEEDRRNGTEYLKTLDVWLHCMQRNVLAGEKLGQHKVTVANRLDRIRDLIREDPVIYSDKLQMGMELHRVLSLLRESQKESLK